MINSSHLYLSVNIFHSLSFFFSCFAICFAFFPSLLIFISFYFSVCFYLFFGTSNLFLYLCSCVLGFIETFYHLIVLATSGDYILVNVEYLKPSDQFYPVSTLNFGINNVNGLNINRNCCNSYGLQKKHQQSFISWLLYGIIVYFPWIDLLLP